LKLFFSQLEVILRSLEWAPLLIQTPLVVQEAWLEVWVVEEEEEEAIKDHRSHQPLDQVLPLNPL
jgi:hypothetical protein